MTISFMLTYGDGVGDVDIRELVEFHKSHGSWPRSPTITPSSRFGVIETNATGRVTEFQGKGKDQRPRQRGIFRAQSASVRLSRR